MSGEVMLASSVRPRSGVRDQLVAFLDLAGFDHGKLAVRWTRLDTHPLRSVAAQDIDGAARGSRIATAIAAWAGRGEKPCQEVAACPRGLERRITQRGVRHEQCAGDRLH